MDARVTGDKTAEETGAERGGEGPLPDLSAIPLFRGLDRATLRSLREEMQWLTLPGGAVLFREGEASDYLYIVISGRLGVVIEPSPGESRFVTQIGPISGSMERRYRRACRQSSTAPIRWRRLGP